MKFKKLCKNYLKLLKQIEKVCEIPETHHIEELKVDNEECRVMYTDGKGDTFTKHIDVKTGELTQSSQHALEKWQERIMKNAGV